MAQRDNLIATYQNNPTLQSQYTQQQYLDLFDFGQKTPQPAPNPPPTRTPPPSGGVTNIIGQNLNQGGDGFNPYNPDMSKINTTYRPNYDYRKSLDYNPELSDLQNQKIMQNTANFKGYDYYNKPAPSGIQQAMLTAAGFIPGVGTAIKGAKFLGNALKGVMPVNQRAILENELRGSGVYTDDIGRIVGDVNTVGGVMAGYNANQMTDKTFDKRTDTIADTLQDKYGIDISSLTEEDIEDFDPNKAGYDLVNRFGLITKAKTNFLNQQKKALEIAEFQKAEKERKKREKEAAAAYSQARRDRDAAVASGLDAAIREGRDTSGFDRPDSGAYAEGAGMGAGGGYASDFGFADGGRVYLYHRLK